MENQKNIPALRFPEFKGEWESKKLGDITNKTDQKNKNKEILPVYSISNKFGFIPQSEQFEGMDSIDRGFNTSLYKIIDNKTFAYNPARINVGSIGYNENLGRVIVSSLYVCFQTKENVNDHFLNHFFETTKFNNSVLTNGEGGVRIYLFYENFALIPFALPTFSEQSRIATFLTTVDSKLKQLKQKKTLLEQYKDGVVQKIFSHEIRFKDENGKDFPEWENSTLGNNCTSIISGKTKPEIEGDYCVYGSTGVIGKSTFYTHSGRCILIARVGANAGRINLADGRYCVTDNTLIVQPKNTLDIDYLYYTLLFINLNRLVFGSGQPLITGGQLKSLNINLPCLTEQTKIANFLSAIDDKIVHCNSQIEKMEAWKRGLLQKMFV